jgi:hypothetical protein
MFFNPAAMEYYAKNGGGGLAVVEMSDSFSMSALITGTYTFSVDENAAFDSAVANAMPIVFKFYESGVPIALVCSLWLDESVDSLQPAFITGIGSAAIVFAKKDGAWGITLMG